MVEHVGQGCGLSFLIVAVFAVLLHERETVSPSPSAKPEVPAVVVDPPKPASPPATRSPLVVTTPPAPQTPILPTAKRIEITVGSAPLPSPPTEVAKVYPTPPKPQLDAARPIPSPLRVQNRPVFRNPDSDFTQVDVGETIESVANRVYGSIEAVETLWRSNRDQVVTKGRPLEPGTWLRTPPCPDAQARLGRR